MMPPLDKAAAVEKVLRSKWRVTIERPSGISWVCDRSELHREHAHASALWLFYEQHPEGALEAIRLYSRAVHEHEIEGAPA